MSSLSLNGVVQANYVYNFMGQQVRREIVATGQVIHSVHDMDGKRIAEYLYNPSAGT